MAALKHPQMVDRGVQVVHNVHSGLGKLEEFGVPDFLLADVLVHAEGNDFGDNRKLSGAQQTAPLPTVITSIVGDGFRGPEQLGDVVDQEVDGLIGASGGVLAGKTGFGDIVCVGEQVFEPEFLDHKDKVFTAALIGQELVVLMEQMSREQGVFLGQEDPEIGVSFGGDVTEPVQIEKTAHQSIEVTDRPGILKSDRMHFSSPFFLKSR